MSLAAILFALSAPAAPIPMRFDHTPLGNVARLLSARFHVPISLAGHATVPITADLTGLALEPSLNIAAAQAGLEVHPVGATPEEGYALRPAPPPDPARERAEAARRRAELLQERARLEQSDSAQGPT